jgi:hypothetical protein
MAWMIVLPKIKCSGASKCGTGGEWRCYRESNNEEFLEPIREKRTLLNRKPMGFDIL